MPRRATFDNKRARELFNEGYSCRRIADTLGVVPSTVSRWAKSEGLIFDHSQTDMATRAHAIDLAAARVQLAQTMVVVGLEGLHQLDAPFLVYSFGGKDNTYNEHELDTAPHDVRNLAQRTAGLAFDKATIALATGTTDDRVNEIKAALLGFRDSLGEVDFDDDANFSGPQPAEVDEPEAGPLDS